jgi:inhibitor of KinA
VFVGRIGGMAQTVKINRAGSLGPLGDTAVTLEFGAGISRADNARVIAARDAIELAAIPGVVETVPTFRALAVHFDPDEVGQQQLLATLGEIEIRESPELLSGRQWNIPVVYDGPDLEEVAKSTGLSPAEIAKRHSGVAYHVYMLGFLPGFAYLGDLPEELRLPRLKEPRTRVPAGSVAIADQLTAIYPAQSPGGWRLIGRTPLRVFDPVKSPPSLLAPGDVITFQSVDEAEFARLEEAAQ